MVGHPHKQRGRGRNRKPRTDLKVCWANVQKGQPKHIALLHSCCMERIDVICVQEPWSAPGTKTQNHPAYDLYAPIDSWAETDDALFDHQRPRVLTYVRKGAGLNPQQRRSVNSRDLLWLNVNTYSILNVYRQPHTHSVLDYVTHLEPPPNCLIGGDFNVWHDTFEPGVETKAGGGHLADWASIADMDFIGAPGEPTHKKGHVLDLTFSNVPNSITMIRHDMHSGSDHETQVTTLPSRGKIPVSQIHYRVPDSELSKFAGLMQVGLTRLPDPATLTTAVELDEYAAALASVFQESITTAGKPPQDGLQATPWWTDECQEARDRHLRARRVVYDGEIPEETRQFLATVRKAKRNYWRELINGIDSDEKLYKVMGWHRLTTSLKAPPLVVNGTVIEDTRDKANALKAEVLGRFSAADDLDYDPLDEWNGTGHLPWANSVSAEEVERYCIGVTSTSPGTDRVTVRLLKACWGEVRTAIHGLFNRCLALNHFPTPWKLAEVAMMVKTGKRDKSSPRSWRPIALLSCISKGLERIIASRIAWTALTTGLLSPQHGGALPKRSALDLAACLTADLETALAAKKHITIVTLDVQGAFDAVLTRRLLKRMTEQGWPLALLQLVKSFLTERRVQVRLEKETTDPSHVQCGTPQGSPLSPVLYMLYLAELLNQDLTFRFGYADDILIYRTSHSLDDNVEQLARDVREIFEWGDEHKIAFAPEKIEMIHITNQRGDYSPPIVVDNRITIPCITTAKEGEQPALRWLGVWFDRRLTFKRHVRERSGKARLVAQHIRGLGRIDNGPPASSLRKAVITCVLPSVLYGTEVWYAGRTKPGHRTGRRDMISTRLGGHVDLVQKTITLAARGVLPVWRTTPLTTLIRDAGLPSASAALEEAKARFAMRLQTVDEHHPLVRRIPTPVISRGRYAGTHMAAKTKIQRIGDLFPQVPRPKLVPPHFSPGCRIDPTMGVDKKTAAESFKKWWANLPPEDVTIFSDGSEKYVEGEHRVGYGYAIYQNRKQIASGCGSINDLSHVFDAEAIGAWKGLQKAASMPAGVRTQRLWMCIDSTSVIWGVRGIPSPSSQWAFLACQGVMETHNVRVKWSPGHMGIEGNEAADKLADCGASKELWDSGLASEPTVSGIRSLFRKERNLHRDNWWVEASKKLSWSYQRWDPVYEVKPLPELDMPRRLLHYYLATKTTHGDYEWYHVKYRHADAELRCRCKKLKTPLHFVLCRHAIKRFNGWPKDTRPVAPPRNERDAMQYLKSLLDKPEQFVTFLHVTKVFQT